MRSVLATAALVGAAFAAPALQPRQAAVTSSAASVASSAASVASSAASAASSSAVVVSSSAASSASAVAAAPSASAAPNVTAGLLAAITARNAPDFANLLAANPTVLQGLVGVVGAGQTPYTFLLPASLTGVTANVSDPAVVNALIHQHILPGNVTATSVPFNNSIQQTTLENYGGVSGAQYLTFYKNPYGTSQISGSQNATILGNSSYQNIEFRLLDQALHLNQNLTATLASQANTTALYAAIQTLPQVGQVLNTGSPITVFAPVNAALTAVTALLATANATTLQNILQNHVIPGQTVTSQAIGTGGGTVTNANGGAVTFTTNSTGTYVTSGGATARLGKTDILGTAGVIHQIEGVLYSPPAAAAPVAASSAASAASSVASATSSIASASASVSALIASAATSAPATASA